MTERNGRTTWYVLGPLLATAMIAVFGWVYADLRADVHRASAGVDALREDKARAGERIAALEQNHAEIMRALTRIEAQVKELAALDSQRHTR